MAGYNTFIIEQLADLEHEQWMKWAKELISKEKLSEARISRWEKECFKPYKELSEEMKEFDREWARKVYDLIVKEEKKTSDNPKIEKILDKEAKNSTEPLLREPEHQSLQQMEYQKTDITNEHDLSTYPKDEERATIEKIEMECDEFLKEAGNFKKFEIRTPNKK